MQKRIGLEDTQLNREGYTFSAKAPGLPQSSIWGTNESMTAFLGASNLVVYYPVFFYLRSWRVSTFQCNHAEFKGTV